MGIRGARNLATPAESIGPVTSTGTTTPRPLADWFGDEINILDSAIYHNAFRVCG